MHMCKKRAPNQIMGGGGAGHGVGVGVGVGLGVYPDRRRLLSASITHSACFLVPRHAHSGAGM